MPELPEIETMVSGLRARARGRVITNIWTDEKKLIHHPSFLVFKKILKGAKIDQVGRRGKIIVLKMKPKGCLLFHPKMTGHFLVLARKKSGQEYLKGKIHLVFRLNNGYYLAWSDQRKFSRIEYWPVGQENLIPWFNGLGQEPLAKDFNFKMFSQLMGGRLIKVKTWLMDQRFMVGIGNIYASEILWSAKVNPEKRVKELGLAEKKKIYAAMRRILKQAVMNRGTSVAEFRDIDNKKGGHGFYLNAYNRKGKKCARCRQLIDRKITGGRSTYYCPNCQK